MLRRRTESDRVRLALIRFLRETGPMTSQTLWLLLEPSGGFIWHRYIYRALPNQDGFPLWRISLEKLEDRNEVSPE